MSFYEVKKDDDYSYHSEERIYLNQATNNVIVKSDALSVSMSHNIVSLLFILTTL